MSVIANHGTKLIGAAITICGIVAAADPKLMGQYGPAIVMIAGGIVTVLRGVQNSANQPQVLPPPVTK